MRTDIYIVTDYCRCVVICSNVEKLGYIDIIADDCSSVYNHTDIMAGIEAVSYFSEGRYLHLCFFADSLIPETTERIKKTFV